MVNSLSKGQEVYQVYDYLDMRSKHGVILLIGYGVMGLSDLWSPNCEVFELWVYNFMNLSTSIHVTIIDTTPILYNVPPYMGFFIVYIVLHGVTTKQYTHSP